MSEVTLYDITKWLIFALWGIWLICLITMCIASFYYEIDHWLHKRRIRNTKKRLKTFIHEHRN